MIQDVPQDFSNCDVCVNKDNPLLNITIFFKNVLRKYLHLYSIKTYTIEVFSFTSHVREK